MCVQIRGVDRGMGSWLQLSIPLSRQPWLVPQSTPFSTFSPFGKRPFSTFSLVPDENPMLTTPLVLNRPTSDSLRCVLLCWWAAQDAYLQASK